MSEGLFEALPGPPPSECSRLPEWRQPPKTERAALVPIRQRLAHSDRGAAVVLSHIDAFSNDCSCRIRTTIHRCHGFDHAEWEKLIEAVTGYHPGRDWHRSQGEVLRFGVQLSDGRQVTTEGPGQDPEHDQQPHGHALTQLGGSCGGDGWLIPLVVAVVVAAATAGTLRPRRHKARDGIDLARTELSGRDIVDAATNTRPLLPRRSLSSSSRPRHLRQHSTQQLPSDALATSLSADVHGQHPRHAVHVHGVGRPQGLDQRRDP